MNSWKLPNFLQLLAVMVVLVPPGGNSYTINLHDCSSPENLKIYQTKTICETNSREEKSIGKTLTLVQKPFASKLTGYSCSIRRSSYYYRCGLWSHLKVAHIPEILRINDVPVEGCREMINKRAFRQPRGSNIYKLELNQPTFLQIQEKGELRIKDDAVSCQGELVHIAGEIQHNVLLSSDFQIILKEETFTEANDQIEVDSDHLSLPCSLESSGCVTGEKTYIWNRPTTTCKLMVLKRIKPARTMNTYLVDHQQKVLVNQTGQMTITGCPFQLYSTNHQQLFLMETDETTHLPYIQPTEVDINLFAEMDRNYLAYQLEEKINHQSRTSQQISCQHHTQEIPTGEPVKILGTELFGMNMGDTYLTFQCANRTSNIREDTNCYTNIPIEPTGFVNPYTRLFTQHSTKISCNRRFPLIVQANEAWIEILPHLKVRPAPSSRVNQEQTSTFESFDKGGIYTERELQEWNHLHSFPQYQKALLTSLSYGSCTNTGDCNLQPTDTGINKYDLSRLVPELEAELNLWKKFKEWLRTYGDLLAFMALLIIGIKFCSDIMIIALAMITAGPAAAAALTGQIFLYNKSTYNRMMRKHRARQQADQLEMQSTTG